MPRLATRAITGLADAFAAVGAMKRRFGTAHAVAALDDRGQVLDLTVFARPHHTIEDALGWADCLVLNEDRLRKMVMLSAVDHPIDRLREADVELFRKARALFARDRIEVVDWILTDGSTFRTMAESIGSERGA